DNDLTPHAYALLKVLQEGQSWVTRAELARALGKSRLLDYDLTLIEKLAVKGVIEIRRRRTAKKNMLFEYKAKG
ncbi:MAG: hypothetical protein ABI835_22200, partial [Chloroflexota bacterium]